MIMTMEKWADYLISAVRHQVGSGRRIVSHFKIHSDRGNSIGESITWTKEEVLEAISKGNTFTTIYKDMNGRWKKGMNVSLARVEEVFVRTDSERMPEDKLTDLPEF
jgi:hypothetical protein